MIEAFLRVVAPAGKGDEMLEVFRGLKGPTDVTKGCRGCRISRDVEDGAVITYWSQWDSREEIEEYFRSERFRRLLPYIEMSAEPPEVTVCNVVPIGGIEILVAAIAQTSIHPGAPSR